MKKVITTLTAVAFALGLAGAGMAQSVGKEAVKPPAKTATQATQSQVAPKAVDKPGEAAKPVAKEEVKPGEKAKPVTKEVTKPGDKAKGKETAKKSTKSEKKVDKKSETPVEKPVKEEKKL